MRLALLLVLLSFASTAFAAVDQNCRDSDRGDNWFKVGTANDGNVSLTDHCASSTQLREAVCNDRNFAAYRQVPCPGGYECEGGSCVRLEGCSAPVDWFNLGCMLECPQFNCSPGFMCQWGRNSCNGLEYRCLQYPDCSDSEFLECNDSDSGLNPGVKGVAQGSGLGFRDKCDSVENVAEAYCNEAGLPALYHSLSCKADEYCRNGACVKVGTPECLVVGSHDGNCGPVACDFGFCGEGSRCRKTVDSCGHESFECVADDACASDPLSQQKLACSNAGGSWGNFETGCADSCEHARNPSGFCLPVRTSGCDCGESECWTGSACENDSGSVCGDGVCSADESSDCADCVFSCTLVETVGGCGPVACGNGSCSSGKACVEKFDPCTNDSAYVCRVLDSCPVQSLGGGVLEAVWSFFAGLLKAFGL